MAGGSMISKMRRWSAAGLLCLVVVPVRGEGALAELEAAGRTLPATPGLSVLALLGLALLLFGVTRLRR